MRLCVDFCKFHYHIFAGCVKDIRVNNVRFPLTTGEQNDHVVVKKDPKTKNTCISDACVNVNCPTGQMCEDRWRMPFCV